MEYQRALKIATERREDLMDWDIIQPLLLRIGGLEAENLELMEELTRPSGSV